MAIHIFADQETTQSIVIDPNTVSYGLNMDSNQTTDVKTTNLPENTVPNNDYILIILLFSFIFLVIVGYFYVSYKKSYTKIVNPVNNIKKY